MSNRVARAALQLTHTGNGEVVTVSKRIKSGRLKSSVVTHVLGTLQIGHAWARLWVAANKTDREFARAVLIEEYVSDQSFAYWTGDLPLGDNMRLVLDVWSTVAADFRSNSLIELVPIIEVGI